MNYLHSSVLLPFELKTFESQAPGTAGANDEPPPPSEMSALIGRSFLRQAQPSRSTWGLILGAEFRFLCISWGGCSDLTKAECCGRCSAKRDFSILFVGLLHFNILFGCYGLVLFCFLFVPGLGNGRCDT